MKHVLWYCGEQRRGCLWKALPPCLTHGRHLRNVRSLPHPYICLVMGCECIAFPVEALLTLQQAGWWCGLEKWNQGPRAFTRQEQELEEAFQRPSRGLALSQDRKRDRVSEQGMKAAGMKVKTGSGNWCKRAKNSIWITRIFTVMNYGEDKFCSWTTLVT